MASLQSDPPIASVGRSVGRACQIFEAEEAIFNSKSTSLQRRDGGNAEAAIESQFATGVASFGPGKFDLM